MHSSSPTLIQAHHTDSKNQKTVFALRQQLPTVSVSWMVLWMIVCQATFLSVTAIGMKDFIFITVLRRLLVSLLKFSFVFVGQKRVLNIAHHFMETGAVKKENQGGSRISFVGESVTNSIISYIQSFYVRSSHYMRNKSCRQYLAAELTVRKMWRLWKSQRLESKLPICSYQKYYHIFSQKFNIGFGTPAVDICSACVNFKNKIKGGQDVTENQTILKLHTLRAKKFCMFMEESRKSRDSLTVAFDMQQNQPLPHINIGETYYSRQLWFYNLAFVIHNSKRNQCRQNVRFYTWVGNRQWKGERQNC